MRVRYLEGGKKPALIIYYFKQPCSAQRKEASYMNREMAAWISLWNCMITSPLKQTSFCSCCTACHQSCGTELNGCFAPLRFISFPFFWSSTATHRIYRLTVKNFKTQYLDLFFWERGRSLRLLRQALEAPCVRVWVHVHLWSPGQHPPLLHHPHIRQRYLESGRLLSSSTSLHLLFSRWYKFHPLSLLPLGRQNL